MIRSMYRTQEGQVHVDLRVDELGQALLDDRGLLWLVLADEPQAVCEPILHDLFGFHPLAVDDALKESHVPKVDDWGSYLYLVLHAVAFDAQAEVLLKTLELDLFVGKNYLVTYQTRPIAAVDRVWAACQRDVRHLERGVGRLVYQLADELVADYMPVIEQMDAALDQIEDEIFGQPRKSLLERVFALKRALLYLRRIIAPQREVLNKLGRGDFAVLDEQDRVFFRDVYDHHVRFYDITEGLRDLVSGALDTYLSVTSNRMNAIIKTLTVITTLFLPISFLVGFFGTNFFQPVAGLNAWTSRPVFALFLVAIVVVPVAMLLWMRKRAWM